MSAPRLVRALLGPLLLALVAGVGLEVAPASAQAGVSATVAAPAKAGPGHAGEKYRSFTTADRKKKKVTVTLATSVPRFAGTLVQAKDKAKIRKRKIRIEGKPIGRDWVRLGAMKEGKKGKAHTVIGYPNSGPWQVRLVLKKKGRTKQKVTRVMGVYVAPDHRPTIIAHRGGAGEAPENTLGAYQQAIARGAKAVETDVQITLANNGDPATRRLVLMHDATLDRTTNAGSFPSIAGRRVRDLTAAEVGQVRGRDGQPVPTFPELLDLIAASPGVVLHAEVKDPSPYNDDVEKAMVAAVAARGLAGRVVFSSFDLSSLGRLRAQPGGGALNLSFIVNTVGEFNAGAGVANSVTLNSGAATTAAIANFHARGLPVYVWTVDDLEFWYRFADAYVDGITSDLPTSAKANVGS